MLPSIDTSIEYKRLEENILSTLRPLSIYNDIGTYFIKKLDTPHSVEEIDTYLTNHLKIFREIFCEITLQFDYVFNQLIIS